MTLSFDVRRVQTEAQWTALVTKVDPAVRPIPRPRVWFEARKLELFTTDIVPHRASRFEDDPRARRKFSATAHEFGHTLDRFGGSRAMAAWWWQWWTQAAVLDVGRRTRAIPTAIKRALWLRDQGCRFPGCANRRFVHGHHIQHWFHGGRTSLDNLLLLCSFHHRLVHEGGVTIALTEGTTVEVRAPSGAVLAAVPPLAPDPGAVECYGDWWTAGDSFAPPLPLWDGGPVDYDEAIGSLAGA